MKKIKLQETKSEWSLAQMVGDKEAPEKEIGTPSLLWCVAYKTSETSSIHTQLTKASNADHAVHVAKSYIPHGAIILAAYTVPSRVSLAYAGYLDEQLAIEHRRITTSRNGVKVTLYHDEPKFLRRCDIDTLTD